MRNPCLDGFKQSWTPPQHGLLSCRLPPGLHRGHIAEPEGDNDSRQQGHKLLVTFSMHMGASAALARGAIEDSKDMFVVSDAENLRNQPCNCKI